MIINQEFQFVEADPEYFLVHKKDLVQAKQVYLSDLSLLDHWAEMTQEEFDRLAESRAENESS